MAIWGQAPANVSDNASPTSLCGERQVINDEEVDIGVDVRRAVGLRTEQHHQQRTYLAQNSIPKGLHKTGIQVTYARRQPAHLRSHVSYCRARDRWAPAKPVQWRWTRDATATAPPGVYKHRSMDDMNRPQDEWAAAPGAAR